MKNRFNQDHLRNKKTRLLDSAWGYARLGMFKEAVEQCKALVDLDANDPAACIELGYYQIRNGENDEALDWFRQMTERFPNYAPGYVNLGRMYQVYKKQPKEAVACYEKALQINPDETWALNNIGNIKQEEGDWKEACLYYKRAFGMALKEKFENKHICTIAHNLGWAYYRCQKYQQAHEIFSDLSRNDINNASVFSDFSLVLYKMKRFEDALDAIEKALSLCKNSRYYTRLWRAIGRQCKC